MIDCRGLCRWSTFCCLALGNRCKVIQDVLKELETLLQMQQHCKQSLKLHQRHHLLNMHWLTTSQSNFTHTFITDVSPNRLDCCPWGSCNNGAILTAASRFLNLPGLLRQRKAEHARQV